MLCEVSNLDCKNQVTLASISYSCAHQKCLQYRVLMTFHCPAQSRGSMMNQNAQVYGVHNNSSTPLRETLTHPMMKYIFTTFFLQVLQKLCIYHAMLCYFWRLHKESHLADMLCSLPFLMGTAWGLQCICIYTRNWRKIIKRTDCCRS